MYNLDSLSLKYFFEENYYFINGAIVQKIQLPSRNEVIINLRNLNEDKPQNKKLYININPKYPHICLITEETAEKRDIKIPLKPPMFCMQLRKYLNGSKIKDFKLVKYERILELYFDYFDEIGSLTKLCLALEFMGKHSNIILYNAVNKTIIGSIHNISSAKSSIREIYGGINYIYPPIKEKSDLLNTSFSTFFEIAKNKDAKAISEKFYYFSQGILEKIFIQKQNPEDIFSFMQELQIGKNKKFIADFWGNKESENINLSIDNYFSDIMFDEILNNKKQRLKSILKNDYQKNLKITKNKPDIEKTEKMKLYGDIIMSNLYSISMGQKEFTFNDIKVELDSELSPTDNAQKYYAKYKKEKTAYKYNLERYNSAKEKLDYYETIIFNIDFSTDFNQISEIEAEMSEIGLINSKQKEQIKSKIEPINYKGYDIYIGKNNKQNDYLISKIAKDDDLWFHGQNFPSAHIILKVPNNKKEPDKDILEFCAKLTKENSKARNGGKAPIIMTRRKYLKKPPNTYLGYVTYKNEIEIVI